MLCLAGTREEGLKGHVRPDAHQWLGPVAGTVGPGAQRELVAEAKTNEKVLKAKVHATLRSSYSSYYR